MCFKWCFNYNKGLLVQRHSSSSMMLPFSFSLVCRCVFSLDICLRPKAILTLDGFWTDIIGFLQKMGQKQSRKLINRAFLHSNSKTWATDLSQCLALIIVNDTDHLLSYPFTLLPSEQRYRLRQQFAVPGLNKLACCCWEFCVWWGVYLWRLGDCAVVFISVLNQLWKKGSHWQQ